MELRKCGLAFEVINLKASLGNSPAFTGWSCMWVCFHTKVLVCVCERVCVYKHFRLSKIHSTALRSVSSTAEVGCDVQFYLATTCQREMHILCGFEYARTTWNTQNNRNTIGLEM